MKKTLHLIFPVIPCLLFFVSSILAQTSKQIGMEHYKKKDYKQAVSFLEKAKKENPADFDTIFFLGASLFSEGKLKQSSENFEKAIELNPKHAKAHTWLAYVFTQRGRYKEALATAEKSIVLNALDPENYYLIGMCKLKAEDWESALENADKAVKLNPKSETAYLLKAQILISAESEESSKTTKDLTEKYGTISSNFIKYVALIPKNEISKEQLDDVNFFTKIYEEYKNKPANPGNSTPPTIKAVKVLKKDTPAYTQQARRAGVYGSVRVLAAFEENGKVSHALVISGLGYGLDEEAVRAAKTIRFEPREENGKPVFTTKTVIYNFRLY